MKREEKGKKGLSRRDFLGIAAFGTAILSTFSALAGTLRFMKPNVRYEESAQFKIGKPENFPEGTFRKLDDKKVFIYSDSDGIYAISSVCTHLGCIVYPTDWGFQCPCHGSQYNKEGKVIAGPAPRTLPWYEINQEVDRTLIVDSSREVEKGTKYIYS